MVEVGLAEGPWSLTDHGRRAEMKLKSNLYDLEAWSVLIREAQVKMSSEASTWLFNFNTRKYFSHDYNFSFFFLRLALWFVLVCFTSVP